MSREFHGLTKSNEYHIWLTMRQRCNNVRNTNYGYYGGRGIKVCDAWQNSFITFMNDMGIRPSELHTVDRIDVDGNYQPSNCKWATKSEQSINKKMMRNNTSGYIGIVFQKSISKWEAKLNLENITYRFGYYEDAKTAAYVRDQVAIQMHGSNARLNFEYV